MISVSGNIRHTDGSQRSFSVSIQVVPPVMAQISDWRVSRLSTGSAYEFVAQGTGIESTQFEIFDLTGALVASENANGTELLWRAERPSKRPIANGVYFYRMTAIGVDGRGLESQLRKLVILR